MTYKSMATTPTQAKTLKGTVVSDAMSKTVVVLVRRYVKHEKYGKFVNISKRYKAHDPEERAHKGDTVTIAPCRPISKDKHFAVVYE